MNYFFQRILFLFFFMGFFSLHANTSYQRLGEEAYAKFEYSKALDFFQKSIDAGNRKGEPWFFMGMIYEFQRKYQESIPYFEKAILLPLEKKEYRQAALWKLVILQDRAGNFLRVVELVDQMSQEGIAHENLNALREKAYSLTSQTEEKLKARKFLAQAEKKENQLVGVANEDALLREIVALLKNADDLDSDIDIETLWKLARYQEKLKIYPDALLSYQKILRRKKNPMAHYKVGIIYKRLNEFDKAATAFSAALSDEMNAQFKYYVYLNLAEVLYGRKNFSASLQNAEKAHQLRKHRIEKEKDSFLSNILVCANLRQKNVFASEAQNSADAQTALEEKEKCQNLYLQNLSTINGDERSFFLLQKFLFEYKQGTKNAAHVSELLRQSVGLCKENEFCYPSWAHVDLVPAAEILFAEQEYLLLHVFMQKENIENWQRHKNYFLWLAESSFAAGDFKAATKAYQSLPIYNLSSVQQQHYWLSLATLRDDYRLYVALRSGLQMERKSANEIFSFLRAEKKFEEFNRSEYFERLKKEFLPAP